MIEKTHWQKGMLLLILVVAVGLFYAVSGVERAARFPGGLVAVRDASPAGEATGPWQESDALDLSDAATESTGDGPASDEAALASGGLLVRQDAASGRRSLDAFRLARTVARSRRIEALEQSLALDDLPLERREAIVAELLALVESEEIEQQAEGLLLARGLTDALVYLSNQRAEVIVVDPIDRDEAGRIGDLVSRIAGVPLDRITIVDGAGE